MTLDDSQLPARIFDAVKRDPASGTYAPPNFGQEIVPHIFTAGSRYGIATNSYLNMDEALRDSKQNAERMRADCGIMECIEQRQRAVALLPWHLEPDDDKDPRQIELVNQMTAIIKRTPNFTEFRRNIQEAIWFGRYGIANQFKVDRVKGKWRTVIGKWEPRHGDKLVFRYDDGSRDTMAGQVGIRVSQNFRNTYTSQNIGGNTGRLAKIQPTEMGLVYWLDEWERKTLVVHKHMVEDGPYEDPRMAGRINGIGIRDRIYWTWYAQTECLQRVIEYLDRAAFGIEVWPYQQGNAQSKAATENAAKNAMGGGRTVILAPVPPGEDPGTFMPQLVEPGLGGVAQTMEIIRTFFGHKMKRYMLGQTLSSEADATGMGSGVADAHMATFADIISYDARNQEETLTKDLVRPLQEWNFRDACDIDLRFVIDTESDNVRERLESIKSGWEMGLGVPENELYKIIGVAKPSADEVALRNPQIAMAANAGANGGIMTHPSGGAMISPESFESAFTRNMVAQRGVA